MAAQDQTIGEEYAIYLGDCVEVMHEFPDECVHMSIYSPPFGGLYHYTSDERDLSNSFSYEQFFEHYEFVVQEKQRVTMPGRISAVHCTDIPSGNTGKDYLTDFPGDVIRLHERNGWYFIARHVIWKEPLSVRNRTMAKSLAHKTVVDDAAYAGVASADYLLVFRKKGQNPVPITHPTGLHYYAGGEPVPPQVARYKGWTGKQTENQYSHWIWQRYASSVWDDIRVERVLPYQKAKDPDDEKHVHPLQLDIVDRAVVLRTNPGETVLTPFMGVGSEVYSAVLNERRAIGIELKSSYYKQAQRNLQSVTKDRERLQNGN